MVEGTENSFHLNLIMNIFNKLELIKVICFKIAIYVRKLNII